MLKVGVLKDFIYFSDDWVFKVGVLKHFIDFSDDWAFKEGVFKHFCYFSDDWVCKVGVFQRFFLTIGSLKKWKFPSTSFFQTDASQRRS